MCKARISFLLLVTATVIIAKQITLNQIYEAENAEGSGILHGALTIAGNIDKISQKNWSATLYAMVPYLNQASKGINTFINVASSYISAFENEGKNIGIQISIPDNILKIIIKGGRGIIAAFKRIENSKLISTIASNKIDLESESGNIIVQSSVGMKFSTTLEYIANQFKSIKSNIELIVKGLTLISNELTNTGAKSYESNILKLGALETKKMAIRIGFIGQEIEDLLHMYKKATITASNRLTILSAKDITKAISVTVQKIAFNFDRIAGDGQLILNGLTNIKGNGLNSLSNSKPMKIASHLLSNVQLSTKESSTVANGAGNTAYTSEMIKQLGYVEMLSDVAHSVDNLINSYKSKLSFKILNNWLLMKMTSTQI